MDIKELNKPQLILLALLLSFVTSIATGITTVTLMQQAPTSVTTPINRIVKQTVEQIQQVEGKTTVQTVVVKEEDLVVDAISKNKSAVFTITKNGLDLENNVAEVSAGNGFLVSPDGIIAADATLVPGNETYFVQNSSGKFKAKFVVADKSGVSFLKIGDPIDPASKASYTLPTFGDISKMKAGQKVVVLGTPITSFIYDGDKNIKIPVTKSNAGGMVINLDGEVLGMALLGESTNFASINVITDALKLATAAKTE